MFLFMSVVYIKNMVCDRCKAAVRSVFEKEGVEPLDVDLGVVELSGSLPADKLSKIRQGLEAAGFEMLEDSRKQTVERIKSLIIELLRYTDNRSAQNSNVSVFIADRMHSDYSALSKLFSAETGMTIEKYVIAQKIELVKELISYGELSLTEIANRLNYSSVAYLSAQFKNVVGVTPSQYRANGVGDRRTLDSI